MITKNNTDSSIDFKNIPKHIAIIMDGNGRWAKNKGLPRVAGHRAGVKVLQNIIKKSCDIKIKYLTLYAFSSENWNRPKSEIQDLMDILSSYLNTDAQKLINNGIKLTVIGRRDRLKASIISKINLLENDSKNNKNLNLVIALDYGGREDIRQAFVSLFSKLKNTNEIDKEISLEDINSNLMTKNIPDPDLIIRTSGEYRISNFLLWQSAYSEYIFLDCNWPDFNEKKFMKALKEYKLRDRRFGKVNE